GHIHWPSLCSIVDCTLCGRFNCPDCATIFWLELEDMKFLTRLPPISRKKKRRGDIRAYISRGGT
ncbi:unnamed protein product, partial [Brassica napus]